jgi:rRNA processing protein Gar1
MKRLGKVKNVMRDGSILLKVNKVVKTGTMLYDARGVSLGRTSRVFGPVEEPYLIMESGSKDVATLALLESEVYYDPAEDAVTKKKRR